MTHEAKTDRLPFTLANGSRGVAVLLIIHLPDGRLLVACRDEDEDADVAVNSAVEQIAAATCQRHSIDPDQLVWLEFAEPAAACGTTVGGWERVVFPRKVGDTIKWVRMTDDDWKELGIPPLAQPIQ